MSPVEEALARLSAAHRAVSTAREVERAAVVNARLHRATWQEIADQLGVTRQSAQERFKENI